MQLFWQNGLRRQAAVCPQRKSLNTATDLKDYYAKLGSLNIPMLSIIPKTPCPLKMGKFGYGARASLDVHPAVQDCAVIAVPHDKWGEAVKAVVQLTPNASATEDELITLCKDKIGGMKAPKSIDFWRQLPRSDTGKILKREIRKKYWSNRQRNVN
jgi:hypothetical protein